MMIEKGYEHWHLDYSQKETDFYASATGFWNDDEEIWEVIFNDLDDHELNKLFGSKYKIDKTLGVLIFKAKNYDDAHNKFLKWVEDELLPLLANK
jgi:hypothetical protein